MVKVTKPSGVGVRRRNGEEGTRSMFSSFARDEVKGVEERKNGHCRASCSTALSSFK